MCIEQKTTPRGVYTDHIAALQQRLLKEGAYLIDLPNKDPRDLARKAKATASSEKSPAANVINGYARAAGKQTNAWTPAGAELPQWVQLAWDKPQTFNVVQVMFQTKALAPAKFSLQAERDGTWKTIAEVTDNRHRRRIFGLDRITASKLRVVVHRATGICEIRVYDEPKRLVEIARRAAKNMLLPDGEPPLPFDPNPPRTRGRRAPVARPKQVSVDPKKLPGIVIQHSGAKLTGRWSPSTHTGPFIGNGYITDDNTDKGAKSVTFTPAVPKAGTYEIRFAYSALANRASNTPVTITTPQGSKTVRVNQRNRPPIDGLFVSLGRFKLDAGARISIVVGNADTDGYVIVDAIQILPAEDGKK